MAETKKYYHNLDVDNNKIINILLNPLTTVERTTIGASLGVNDKGYVCYDITLNAQYFWNGSAWVVNTASWGSIAGTITAQTDLISYLSTNYYPLTNPAGYITASALTPYLTTASAALTYEPIIAPGTTSEYWRGDKTWQTFPTIPTVTPSALTKVDDTNVTLTLGGSPSTALLAATSLTLAWTGTLADSRIASASTWNAKFTLPTLASGSVLFSNGTTIAQDNTNFFWDDANNRLGIGTNAPITQIDLGSGTGTAGSISKIALYSSIYGTYGLGVSPNQLDYVSANSHVFYKNSPSLTELFRISDTGTLTALSLTGTGTRMVTADATGVLSTQAIPTVGTWGALNYPIWTSGTPFVKMTAAGTFALDTNTYLTSVGTGVANQLTYWSGTNTLGSLSTGTYPSLTELSYVKGVTSAIQTQLDTKNGIYYKYASNTYQTVAGTITQISTAIPSSVFSDGDLLRMQSTITTTTNATATIEILYFINSTNSIVGATQIGRYTAATIGNRYFSTDRYFWVLGGSFYGRGFNASGQSSSAVSSGTAVNSVVIPTTQFYIIVQAITTGTDLAAISQIQVSK